MAYEVLEWDQIRPAVDGFDQVSIAVLLEFGDNIQFTLRWLVREPFECLTSSDWSAGEPRTTSRVIDVSQRWKHLLGAQVVDQRVSTQETEWGSQPWSVRLDFDTGCGLVVCLGELTPEGVATYLPDSLLITGSEKLAVAYRPPAAATNAWG